MLRAKFFGHGAVSQVVWFVVFTAATLTVVFFGAENFRPQVLMTAFLALLTSTSVFAIADIG
jgi:hypothetical protein